MRMGKRPLTFGLAFAAVCALLLTAHHLDWIPASFSKVNKLEFRQDELIDDARPSPGRSQHKGQLKLSPATPAAEDGEVSVPGWSTSTPSPALLRSLLIPRLRDLLLRPVPEYAEALVAARLSCPNGDLQANVDQLRNEVPKWRELSAETLMQERRAVAERVADELGMSMRLDSLESGAEEGMTTLSDQKWSGMFGEDGRRGIVITAGNRDTSLRVLALARVLRRTHKCKLPIEIWGYPRELVDLGSTKVLLEKLGDVRIRKIEGSKPPQKGAWKNFQIKGEAIARSSFAEVLYLDSDNVPVRDPTFLFDAPVYQEHGIVLWPDLNKDSPSNPVFRFLPGACDPTEFQTESGQLLVSKRARGGLNLAALLIAAAMQARHEWWFGFSGGDKETFRWAFRALDLPYGRAPEPVKLVGRRTPAKGVDGHTFCGVAMLQSGLSKDEWRSLRNDLSLKKGELFVLPTDMAPPLFVHANLLKHRISPAGEIAFDVVKSYLPGTLAASQAGEPTRIALPMAAQELAGYRATVFDYNGMCTDIWDAQVSGGAGEHARLEHKGEVGKYERGLVTIERVEDAFGGLLRRFEEAFYSSGAPRGGW